MKTSSYCWYGCAFDLMNWMHVASHCRYERWLRKARQEDLGELSRLHCLYHSGFDKHGRPVVIFIAKNLPFHTVESKKVR